MPLGGHFYTAANIVLFWDLLSVIYLEILGKKNQKKPYRKQEMCT